MGLDKKQVGQLATLLQGLYNLFTNKNLSVVKSTRSSSPATASYWRWMLKSASMTTPSTATKTSPKCIPRAKRAVTQNSNELNRP